MTAKKAKKTAKTAGTEAPDVEAVEAENGAGTEDVEAPGADDRTGVADRDAEPVVEAEIDPLQAMTAERDDYRDKWLRAVAELENLRKRTRREITDAHTFTRMEMVRGLLEVLDNFDRAESSLPEDAAAHAEFTGFLGGVQLVHDRLRAILETYGLKKVEAGKGVDFDPGCHEAVAQIDDPDVPEGAIVAVAQDGYRMGEIVVRPARVMVAK